MSLSEAIKSANSLFVQQKKEWTEILVDFETSNRYAIMDSHRQTLGMIAERGGGLSAWFKRLILRSHRGFEVDVLDRDGQPVMHLSRSFFFFFSDLFVKTPQGQELGSVHRRFGLIYKKYDLKDSHGRVFATVKSPLWRLWTFPIQAEHQPVQDAAISKRWGGGLREIFTDADVFRVDFGSGRWSSQERSVIFACSISIDFDFFENNQGSGGLVDLLPG